LVIKFSGDQGFWFGFTRAADSEQTVIN